MALIAMIVALVSAVAVVIVLVAGIVLIAIAGIIALVAAWATVTWDKSLGHGSNCSVKLEASLCTNERCKD